MTNREIAEAFAAQFDPPLAVVRALRINSVPHRDAWMCATFDAAKQMGVTAHAYAGQIHAYWEVLGDDAASLGDAMATRMGLKRQNEQSVPVDRPENPGVGAQEGNAEQGTGQGEAPGGSP